MGPTTNGVNESLRTSIEGPAEQSLFTVNRDATLREKNGNESEQPVHDEDGGNRLVDSVKKPVTGFTLTLLVFAVTLTGVMIIMDMTILVTAVPEITSVFHALDDIGWYANAYFITVAVLLPLAGKLAKHFHTRWLYLGFLFFFALGSAICGAAQSSTMLIIGRAVAGIGGSGTMTTGLVILAAAVTMEKRGMMYAIVIGTSQVGGALGPVIGGALTEHASWRWCFYINLPVSGAVAAILIFSHIPDESTPLTGSLKHIVTTKLDLIGFAILAPASVMALLGLAYGGVDYAWDSSIVIGLLVAAGVGFILFFLWETRMGDEGMLPTTLLRRRIVWTACGSQCMFFGSVYIGSYYLSVYFQSARGDSPLEAGVNVLPAFAFQFFATLISGIYVQRAGYYLPLSVLGGVGLGIGYGLLSTLDPHSSTAQWAGYQVILGLGRGLPMQVGLLAVQANVGPSLVTIGTAMVLFSQQFGGAFFIALGRVIFSTVLRDELNRRLPDVDAEAVIEAGARGVWSDVVAPEYVQDVVSAYSTSATSVYYLGAGLGVGVFILSWGVGWVNLNKKPEDVEGGNQAISDTPTRS